MTTARPMPGRKQERELRLLAARVVLDNFRSLITENPVTKATPPFSPRPKCARVKVVERPSRLTDHE